VAFGRLREEDVREHIDPSSVAVVQENTAFALDLYKALRAEEGNLFFSPYSISVAFAMTYAGARGETGRQMAQVLHFPSEQQLHPIFSALEAELKTAQQSGGTLLRSANSLYPQTKYPFLEVFLTLLEMHYGAQVTALDYKNNPEAARDTINSWVAAKTEEKIKDLIPAGGLTPLTRLVLVNAIYFKGNWTSQFDQSRTIAAPFWIRSDHVLPVPMMQQTETFGYNETKDLQVLELPYRGDRLSMMILLPQQKNGLTELENNLTLENLAHWTRELQPREVQISLPRFKINCPFKLNDTLIAMGMKDAFDENKANFSGMDGQENWLYIEAVFHQAFVDVNEEGSEAVAATAVVTGSRSLPPPPAVFQANHPFIFLIREQHTGNVLFLGRFVTPEAVA
jgi:serpin B